MRPGGGNSGAPRISVCIVSGRRPEELRACVRSLSEQADPPAFEVLVAADRDPSVAAIVAERFPDATVGVAGGAPYGASRKFLVERALGELILFLDDDVVAPPHLLRSLERLAADHPEADVFGGPNENPRDSSLLEQVQGHVLSSLVGAGPVRRRYRREPGRSADERSFTFCNLAVRRSALIPFDLELPAARENALLAELKRAGAIMRYDPLLGVEHRRRPTLASFSRQVHLYGRGRGQLMRRNPSTVRLGYLAPTALILYVAGAIPVSVTKTRRVFLPLLLYAGGVGAGGIAAGRRTGNIAALPLAVALIIVMHGAYGTGILRGLARRRPGPAIVEPTWHQVMPRPAGSEGDAEVAELRA